MEINYRPSASSHTTSVLSYTVLEDGISYERLPSMLEEAVKQGLTKFNRIMNNNL